MDSLSQALWQYALEERKLEVQRLQRVQQRMQLEEQRLQHEQQVEMQRIQLEQQYEDQCRQSEFEEVIDLCSLFVPVPKPRIGIKSGIGKRETQPDNVVSDKCRFVPVPKPRTSIKPGDGRREAQPGIIVPLNTRRDGKTWWQIVCQGWILPQNEGVLSGESFSRYLVCI